MAQRTVCFDLDGVLCSLTAGDYENATPNVEAIAVANDLYERGARVIIHTARFMGRTGGDPDEARRQGLDLTRRQLADWGVRFHELHMGKPSYDVVVDDRAVFFEGDWARIKAALSRFAPNGSPAED
jgi:CMP-N,N'-diacetyllegionaminic acid synthase